MEEEEEVEERGGGNNLYMYLGSKFIHQQLS